MKKLIVFVLVLGILGGVAYAGYRFYLPELIAESLISDEPSSLVPAKMQEKVDIIKRKVDEEIDKLPVFLSNNKIAYADLQIMIDRAEPAQFLDVFEELVTTRITSTNQVFDIGMKHIKIEGYDLEVFRAPFVKHTSVEGIEKAIDKYGENEFITNMSIPVIKLTAKKLLESAEPGIQKELNELNRTKGE